MMREKDGLYLRDKTYWMSFVARGQRFRRSTGTGNRKTAELVLGKVKGQVVEGKWFEMEEARMHSIDQLMERYLAEHSKINKSPRSHLNDKITVRHLLKFFSGLSLDQVSPNLISDYKSLRLREGMAPQTVLHEMNCLSHAFNLAMKEWGWVIHNPCMNVKKPKVNNQILRWLSQDEEEALLPASQGYLHGQLPEIITVALHTGMRQGEILTLKWKNIDLFRKTITVMQGKTNEPKTIPMSETLFTLLTSKSKIVNMSGYVFHTGNGTRISGSNLQREFWKVLEKAKIESFRFHDLRHTFATRLVQNGVDLYSVSKLLGHRDVKMTQRYAHHHTESLRQCITVLDNCIVQNKQRELKR